MKSGRIADFGPPRADLRYAPKFRSATGGSPPAAAGFEIAEFKEPQALACADQLTA